MVAALSLAYFVTRFDPSSYRPTVDAAWLVAVVCWVVGVWRCDAPAAPHLSQPYWAYALYFVALLPFCTNWRWAMTGDSVVWPAFATQLVDNGPMYSLLSLKGVAQFSYTQLALHNLFMILVAPTLFWHRVGQLGVGVLGLAAMYNVYGRLVHPRFGLLVAACALTTSIMIVHTYSSYPILDAIPIGHAIFAAGLCARSQPVSRRAWIALGLFSGLALYLTPSAWMMGLCVWIWLLVLAARRRWPWPEIVVAMVGALIVGLPALLQIRHGQAGTLLSLVDQPAYTAAKLWGFFQEAATMPFWSNLQSGGAFGAQLPEGFRWLFPVGVVLALLYRPAYPAARLLLAFLVAHVVFLVFTQGSYESVSVKRALVLIPLATYFVFIGFQRFLHSLPVVLLIIAVWAALGVYDVVYRVRPGRLGYTFLDGIVEANQRFADAPVCVFLSRDLWSVEFGPGGPLDNLYGIAKHLRQVSDPHDAQCATYLCYCPQLDAQVDLDALGYNEIPMLNSSELRCGKRVDAV
jgi:hypothetical protein